MRPHGAIRRGSAVEWTDALHLVLPGMSGRKRLDASWVPTYSAKTLVCVCVCVCVRAWVWVWVGGWVFVGVSSERIKLGE